MLPPPVAIDTASYKIFVSGKSGVGKTALVAKLAGLEVPVVHHETTGESSHGGLAWDGGETGPCPTIYSATLESHFTSLSLPLAPLFSRGNRTNPKVLELVLSWLKRGAQGALPLPSCFLPLDADWPAGCNIIQYPVPLGPLCIQVKLLRLG